MTEELNKHNILRVSAHHMPLYIEGFFWMLCSRETRLLVLHSSLHLPGLYLGHYEVHISPVLNRSSAIRRFKGNDTIEICNRITFDF